MRYYDAAVAVLRKASRPMTSREITDSAIEQGLIAPSGRTPEATMSAALYTREGPIRKVAEPGPTRAKRNSVRWTL